MPYKRLRRKKRESTSLSAQVLRESRRRRAVADLVGKKARIRTSTNAAVNAVLRGAKECTVVSIEGRTARVQIGKSIYPIPVEMIGVS